MPPEPRDPAPRLWVVLACEDDPRACTGRRLLKLRLAREASFAHRPPPGALLLDPHAELPLTRADGRVARARGLVAIDCSWNRLGRRGSFPPSVLPVLRGLVARRLPLLLAANPQHYGRWMELNTAEALGAAVRLTCGREEAAAYFARLAGGTGFLELNAAPFEEYDGAQGPRQVSEIEERYSSSGP